MNYRFDPERIAYWFFRLNGCFTIDNFLVHHYQRGFEGTDIDILAMRFPYRRELASSTLLTAPPMEDHSLFEFADKRTHIYLVEVKRGQMRINPSWQNPKNLQRLLYAIGAFPEEEVLEASRELAGNQSYANKQHQVQYVALGRYGEEGLPDTVETLSWDEVASFIYQRLVLYGNQKVQHRQWERTGRHLYKLAQQVRYKGGKERFVELVIEGMT